MPGPPKKPIELRLLDGTLNPTIHGKPEDMIKFSKAGDDVTPPDYLTDSGIEFWNAHYPELTSAGVMQSTDLDSFGYLCWLVQKVYWADSECEKIGWVETSESGTTRRPALAVQRADWVRELIQFKTRFGLFPSHRNELQSSKKKQVVSSRQR